MTDTKGRAMPNMDEQTTADEAVVLQAAAIVTDAVRTAVTTTLRAADVCGCRHCRAEASRTFLWSVGMLADESEADGR